MEQHLNFPSQPPGNHFTRLSSFNLGFQQQHPTTPNSSQQQSSGGGDRVHVAVGKSIEKTIELLHWTFRHFKNHEIGLLHVHQPSPTIPTLLGKLPAVHANEEVVTAYRREEREQCNQLLSNYMDICSRAMVKADIITVENGQVQKGIAELVNKHSVRKLVMGAVPDICMKVTKSTTKANYSTKAVPSFCEIWFVNKGKHVWTRKATEDLNMFTPVHRSGIHAKEKLASKSSHSHKSEKMDDTILRFNSYPRYGGVKNWIGEDPDQLGDTLSVNESSSMARIWQSATSHNDSTSASGSSSADTKALTDFDLNSEEETYSNEMFEAREEAETLKNEAFAELLKRRTLEGEAAEAITKVKAFEASYAHEVQRRKEIEDMLRNTRQQQEQLLEERKNIGRELQKTMSDVAVLNSRVDEAKCNQNQAARKLMLIQKSLTTLQDQRQKMDRQKREAMAQLERWRSHRQARSLCSGSANTSVKCTKFSLFDLQTATCNFSDSFIIGHGGSGYVYKGEIIDKSVAVKKLHALNMEGMSEFEQEVEALCKIKHPCLVTLIGVCPEAWSIVYEYLPNGSIQDHLFGRKNTPLTWKTRTHIVADISSALLYLHSSKRIPHGNLKPDNILFDSEFNCKIVDLGICRLIPKKAACCPSFRGLPEIMSAFPYIDPELQKPEDLTTKSDIYAFGVIILQLLTGRSPVGLASEVRHAVLCGNLTSILDPSAGEWPTFVARRLAELGLQCCELKSHDRPELKPALVKELEKLHLAEEQPVPSFFLCPILKELMHDPHIAADGFTYEGEALHGWLNQGRDTSPMTNLTLSHLRLTPNHALRRAIQDWLCQS